MKQGDEKKAIDIKIKETVAKFVTKPTILGGEVMRR